MDSKIMMMMMMMVVVVVVADSERGTGNQRRRRQDNQMAAVRGVPKEYAVWHSYNERFLAHLSTPPSALGPEELKAHLNTLLVVLPFLPTVNAYLDTHLGQVHRETQARTIFTLLDLYSAQEPHRHRYLQQIRQAFVEVFKMYPDFGRATVPSQFFLDGFDRRIRQMKRDTKDLYIRVLVPAPANLDLVSYYYPGRQPSLDLALTRHGLPSPLLVMKKDQLYQVRQADAPHLSLALHLSTWRLTFANHSLQHTHFRFKGVSVPFGGVRYQVQSAVLPVETHLSYPCRHDTLCFDYQRAAEMEVVGLPDGEVAIIHKIGLRSYFLHTGGVELGDREKIGEPDSQPRFHHRYPGRSSHWVLIPRP